MKRSMLISIGVFCFVISNAQNSWGLQASLDFDKVLGEGMANKFASGYNAGAYAQIHLVKNLSIQPQFLFSRRNVMAAPNFKSVYPESASSNFNSAISMDYISVPLLLNYKINNLVSMNLGPQYSNLLDTDEKLLAGTDLAFKEPDFSLIAGAEFKLASFKLYGYYSYGIYDLNKIYHGQHKWTSRGLQFGIGWKISR